MSAHLIQVRSILRGGELDDEIWADTERCRDAIIDLLGPAPGTLIVHGEAGSELTKDDTWCGACGTFLSHGAGCGCLDRTATREPMAEPPFAARCAGCDQAAVREPPRDHSAGRARREPRPDWSHADRTALCRIPGPDGLQPGWAEPVQPMPPGDRIRSPQPVAVGPGPRPADLEAEPG